MPYRRGRLYPSFRGVATGVVFGNLDDRRPPTQDANMRRLLLLLILCLCLTFGTAQAQTPTLRMQVFAGSVLVPAPGHSNTELNQSMRLWLRANTSGTRNPPFTITSTLPEGLLLDSYTTGKGQESDWNCTAAGPALTCVFSAPLVYQVTFAEVNLRFRTEHDFPPPASGALSLTFRVDSPDVPMNPNPASCTGNSITTCASGELLVSRPKLTFDSMVHSAAPNPNTYNNAPMQPGSFGMLSLKYDCTFNNGSACGPAAMPSIPSMMVDHYYALPPGLHWRPHTNFPLPPQISCTKLSASAAGELIRCTQLMSMQVGARLYLDVSPDITAPATVMAHTIVDSPYQPAPESCTATPGHPNCASHPIDIIAPTAGTPLLVFEGNPKAWAQPDTLMPNQISAVTVRFSNRGNDAAAQATLQLRLPPGFAYAGVPSGTALVCTASGNPNTGQTVACLRPVVIPAYSPSYTETLLVQVAQGIELPSEHELLFEIAPAATGNVQRLDVCTASPALGQCAQLMISVTGNCPQHGANGIYCDGFEAPPQATPFGFQLPHMLEQEPGFH